MTTVTQGSSLSQIATDPLRNFKFRVVLNPPGTTSTAAAPAIGFMSVSGLNVTVDVIAYREGGYNPTTQKLPGQADFSPITLSKGVAFGNTYDVDWLRQIFTAIQGTGTAASGSDFRYTVDIQVLDFPNETTSAIVKAWFRVYKAWPTSIAWSDLDAGANQLFISQLSLAHEGFDFTIATGAGSAQANNPQTGTA